MYLKLRANKQSGHWHITFFIGKDEYYTKVNAGYVCVRDEEYEDFKDRINYEELEENVL